MKKITATFSNGTVVTALFEKSNRPDSVTMTGPGMPLVMDSARRLPVDGFVFHLQDTAHQQGGRVLIHEEGQCLQLTR